MAIACTSGINHRRQTQPTDATERPDKDQSDKRDQNEILSICEQNIYEMDEYVHIICPLLKYEIAT